MSGGPVSLRCRRRALRSSTGRCPLCHAHRVFGIFAASLLALFFVSALSAQQESIAERLGLSRRLKLLVLHTDDLAVSHSEDAARFDAFDKGAITSVSIIFPGRWLTAHRSHLRTEQIVGVVKGSSSLFRTTQFQSKRVKTRWLQAIKEYRRVQNFQNGSTRLAGLRNRSKD